MHVQSCRLQLWNSLDSWLPADSKSFLCARFRYSDVCAMIKYQTERPYVTKLLHLCSDSFADVPPAGHAQQRKCVQVIYTIYMKILHSIICFKTTTDYGIIMLLLCHLKALSLIFFSIIRSGLHGSLLTKRFSVQAQTDNRRLPVPSVVVAPCCTLTITPR